MCVADVSRLDGVRTCDTVPVLGLSFRRAGGLVAFIAIALRVYSVAAG
jgi:hypothetical protein